MNEKQKTDFIDSLSELFTEIFHEPIQFVDINQTGKPKPPEDEYEDFLKRYEDCKDYEFRIRCDEVDILGICDADCENCKYKDECDEDTICVDLQPEKVIINNPATVIYWTDGTKTVVKCHKEDTFDAEKGIVMATLKKICGNTGSFNEYLKSCLDNAIVRRA